MREEKLGPYGALETSGPGGPLNFRSHFNLALALEAAKLSSSLASNGSSKEQSDRRSHMRFRESRTEQNTKTPGTAPTTATTTVLLPLLPPQYYYHCYHYHCYHRSTTATATTTVLLPLLLLPPLPPQYYYHCYHRSATTTATPAVLLPLLPPTRRYRPRHATGEMRATCTGHYLGLELDRLQSNVMRPERLLLRLLLRQPRPHWRMRVNKEGQHSGLVRVRERIHVHTPPPPPPTWLSLRDPSLRPRNTSAVLQLRRPACMRLAAGG
jgi:hypothetical protein